MGRRGPPPKPPHMHVVNGTHDERRHGSREAAREAFKRARAEGVGRAPAWLSPAAKREWKRLAPELQDRGLADRLDRDALAAYCSAYARWKEAEAFLEQHGSVYPLRDERGKVRYMAQFPQVSIARQLLQLIRNYQQEFGLTPSSRPQVSEPKRSEGVVPLSEFAAMRARQQ